MASCPAVTALLLPREHGAYVQLLAPLAAALAVAPSRAGALLAAASVALFALSEPVRLLAGLRGKRARQAAGGRAWAWATVSGGLGVTCALLAIVDEPGLAVPLAPVAVAGALVAGLAWRRVVHTLGGELVAATALSGAAFPVLVAGGAALGDAAITWGLWAAGYATTVIAVHHVLTKRPPRAATVVRGVVLAAVTAGALAVASIADPRALALASLAAASTVTVVVVPPPRRVRTVGVAFLIASLASGAALIAAASGA